MQRLMFASAALVLGAFASEAGAVQDLPGYDLHRGAGSASSFYAEGFAGYPGSYGAGMYVAGYGYAGNGYSGFGGPVCCGTRVTEGDCNPWAGYTAPSRCGHHFRHMCRWLARCCAPADCCEPAECCEVEPTCCDEDSCCDPPRRHWGRLWRHRGCAAADCCGQCGCAADHAVTVEGDAIEAAPATPPVPPATPIQT
jgi:hypothetical protein